MLEYFKVKFYSKGEIKRVSTRGNYYPIMPSSLSGYYLRPILRHVNKTTCKVSLNWYYSSQVVDPPPISYLFIRRARHNDRWIGEEVTSVGNETKYSTKCTLQPGRRYLLYIKSNISLTDPDEIVYEYSSSTQIVMSKYFYNES